MHSTKKIRCPHCKKIVMVDMKEELKTDTVYKRPSITPEIEPPKTISMTCSRCDKKFKINVLAL